MRCWPLFALVIAACTPVTGTVPPIPPPDAAAPPPQVFDAAAIDAWVATQLQRHKVVGAQLVIAKDGDVVLTRSYGHVTVGGDAVTDETAFAIGSVTKQFVCVAALKLEAQGKIAMTDPVAKYWPNLTRAADVTLDDLGSHLSGYADFYPLDFLDRRMQQPIEHDDLIAQYAGRPLDFEPRTKWSYSNTGFIMLGRLVEQESGVALGKWMGEQLFAPAQMEHASLDPPDDAWGLARGHLRFALGDPEPIRREAPGWIFAAGGIYASAADLMRWNFALAGDALLPADAKRKMTTPRVLTDGRSTDYGCGLGVRNQGGEVIWSHSGAVSGFLAFNAFVPRTKTGVTLLVNTEGVPVGDVHQAVLGLAIAPAQHVPVIAGKPAAEVAREIFVGLQAGALDPSKAGEELVAFYDAKRLAAARSRLGALGSPTRVEIDRPRERGGMEVTSVRIVLPDRMLRATMFRSTDGRVQQFLVLAE